MRNHRCFVFNDEDADVDADNETVSLNAIAINPQGGIANIRLAFSDFTETGNCMKENRANYAVTTGTPYIDGSRRFPARL